MKYTLFIYFYNHILVLIICVSNSLDAGTWSYRMCFFWKFYLNIQRPCCGTLIYNPLWEDEWAPLLPWVGSLVSGIIPKKALSCQGQPGPSWWRCWEGWLLSWESHCSWACCSPLSDFKELRKREKFMLGRVEQKPDLSVLGHSLEEISLFCTFIPLLPLPFLLHTSSPDHEEHQIVCFTPCFWGNI